MFTQLPLIFFLGGGLYSVPHELASAVILPYVLEFSRKEVEK